MFNKMFFLLILLIACRAFRSVQCGKKLATFKQAYAIEKVLPKNKKSESTQGLFVLTYLSLSADHINTCESL